MRIHRGKDGWGRDSYLIPQFAVVGVSDTGTWPDSPARSEIVGEELEDFRKVLRANRIRSRLRYTQSGNVFCLKKWVVVTGRDFEAASRLAEQYLEEHQHDTRYIHDAA